VGVGLNGGGRFELYDLPAVFAVVGRRVRQAVATGIAGLGEIGPKGLHQLGEFVIIGAAGATLR